MNTYTPKNQTLIISKLHCFILVMAFLLGAAAAFAQPANNLCSGAIPLTVNAPCTSGTNVAATTTPATDGATGCWASAASHTVWYQFTTSATPQTYVISTDNGGTADAQMKLFTSACTGTLAPAPNCNEDVGASGTNTLAAVIVTSTLAPSTTYYIEIDIFGGTTGPFCISVSTLPDACANAITLVAGTGCTTGTNAGATTAGDGAGVGAASCWTGANAYSNSVFYNFVATNDSMTVSFGNGSLGTDLFGAIYSGTCGSLVQLPPTSCTAVGNDLNVTGLTVGNTYYIMVDGSSTFTGTFCISVSSSLPGNGRLVPLVNYSGCGLNFVQASARVTSRYAGLAGTGLPCTLPIAGIPATCRVIDKAFLFYETSYSGTAPVTSPGVTVVNPAAASFPYSASLIGRSHQKCWGEMGTASYRTDVTSSITGNGNYIINTTLPANEIDGMTLLIIYKDQNASYEGHILIDNGIITINSFAAPVASHTITGVNACAASTGTSFLIAGDFQYATHTNTATGASTTVPVDNFWNFDQAATNYTLGQPSISFSTTSNYVVVADCFSLVATGAYYQTTTCTTCNLPLTVSVTPTQPTCGLNNGAATANPSTTIYAPYTYLWSPGGMSTQTVTGLAPGTYTVTISDPTGCKTATTTVTMNASSPATASVSPASVNICNGNSTTLTASGGGTYSWDTGPTTAAISVSPAATTTYTVTVTVATCTATATSTVNVTQPGVATFSYTGTPYCQSAANPSPTFSGGGTAGTFSSTAGLVFVSTATGEVNLSTSTPGTYTVTNTVPASGPCPAVTATATITITPLPVATFSYTGTPYCQNAANPSPTFSGGGVAGTFSSTAGLVFVSAATGEVNLSASTAGTYTVTNTIAASGGCPVVTATASITITAPQVATFSYTGSPYCQTASNPSPTFSGGGVAGTFSSTAGLVFVSTATGQVNLSASTAGTYTVTNTIAASGGCPAVTATASITITAPQVATFSYTASPYCQNAVNPSPTFSGGGVAGTFSSTAGLVFVSTATGQVNLSASTPGTYTVTNTIAASGGCPAVTATASITITAPQIATFSYTGTPYCQNATNPSPTFSGGGVAGTFSSTAGLVFVSTATGEVNLATSTPGTYTVTNTIAASGGCPAVTATASITITAPQVATFSYTASPYCQNAANPSPTFSGGGVAGTFSSTVGLVFVSTATGQVNLSASTAGTYTVTNTIAASGGCPAVTATASITITAPQVATFSYTGTPYCQNATNPSPTFSGGGVAGTFSSTAGLVFVSTATGEINLSASTTGTYTVTNTIAPSGGCPAVTATATITINPVQSAAFNYASSTFCATGTNPTPTITGTLGGTFTSSPAGLIFVSSATGEIDLAGSTLNTYTVTYTTAGPCSNSSTATVTITNAPVATFSYTGTPYCQNAANPSPTFSGGGTAGVFSSTAGLVFVSTTSGQVDLAASTAGTYTVTNTIAASGGCSAASATASITINPVQNSGFNYSSPTFCQTGTNPTPTITGVAGGTFTSSPAGLIFVSSSTGEINLSGSSLNTYTVTYTTAGPCSSSSTATVTISNPTSAVMNYNGPYCQSAANPTPVFGAGASAGTFSSTAGLVFVSTATGEVNLSASTAGTYVITNTIAASGGCPASVDTAGITITAPQTATFSYTGTPFCQGGTNPSPTYSAGGAAGTFSASSGSLIFVSTATGEIDLSASTPGTYTITNTIAASGGCPAVTATSNITITAPQVATFSYTGTPYCQNAANPSPTFSGGGIAGTFSSTAGLVFVSTATGELDLAASTTGTYTVTNTIAASAGCPVVTATATITINPVQSAAFNYASSTFCATGTNPTPTITGTAGGTFTSSPAGLTFVSSSTGEINLAGSSLNTYTVTYTTAGPCSNSSTATVTITNAPVATFSYTGTPYCQNAVNPFPTFSGGGTAGVFSSTTGLVFVNTATGEVDLLASTPGTYTVTNTITASGGCAPASATASITIDPLQNAGFNYSASTFCATGTNPNPTITGVTGGTFTASPAGLVFVSSTTGEINLAGSSLNTYTITYTTPGPCTNTSTASVTITNSPVATFSFTGSPYCQSAANPSPTFSGGGTAGTFSSTIGCVFVSSSTGQINLAASTPGTYTITNTIPASGGCPAVTATSSVTITAPQTATFSYTGTPYCQNATDPSPTFSGGSVSGTFSSTAGLSINASTGVVNLASSTAGTYTVTNTLAASGGCPAVSATSTITITPLQNAGFNYSSPTFCQTGTNPTPTITGVAGGTFTSSPAGLVFVNTATGEINLSGSSLNIYTITYTTPGPCANSSTATVSITPSPTAVASSVNVCAGQTLNLTSSGGGTYSWVGPNSFTSLVQNPSVTNASTANSGTYTVTINTGGCTDTAQVTVTVYSLPTASAGTDITISSGTSVTLNASGGTSYTWNASPDLSCTNCANPTVSPTQTTTYCVVVSNGNCTESACVTITVETPCPTNKELEVPNAFSPNNDGSNDLFCIPGWDGCIDKFHILIFDRWGEKVFESTDASFCWDGAFRGQTMNPGVFVYYINATIFNGDKIIKKGNISLIQ